MSHPFLQVLGPNMASTDRVRPLGGSTANDLKWVTRFPYSDSVSLKSPHHRSVQKKEKNAPYPSMNHFFFGYWFGYMIYDIAWYCSLNLSNIPLLWCCFVTPPQRCRAHGWKLWPWPTTNSCSSPGWYTGVTGMWEGLRKEMFACFAEGAEVHRMKDRWRMMKAFYATKTGG